MNFDLEEYCTILIYGKPGSGKTEWAKNFINTIPHERMLIITSSPRLYAETHGYAVVNHDYDIEQVSTFIEPEETKIVLFDDFLHIGFNGRVGAHIRTLISTCRHTHTYVIACTQALKLIGKPFRLCQKLFLCSQLDEDSIKLLKDLGALTGQEIREIKARAPLKKYEFIYYQDSKGTGRCKLRLN